ncbi:wax ester/triacylglycerol synthase family O-acyltransferase [Streptomyces jumonjinensis]|uniref:Diacylglycerol O-acyltransferase n=1 Tax=Streptomyces jumonjinensis TaxID=1945 RepID=A0A646KF90_STRJU|nr:wax ester/triacylglycerol synthase family O-acyltransferase [Streptomyces jumonjinensis]MQT00731.1 wax ester/triacylglycerol synthase family O-acyltransferase [Streptomyces jumonjinensis]
MSSERLAPLDLAFWHLESDGHPMHLGALAFFAPAEGTGGGERVLELLAARAAAIPRLRLRVRDVLLPVGGAAWAADEDFDIRRHVRRLALSADDFAAEATAIAGELMERPLERGHPPWEMHLLTGGPDDDFAVLVKLHHALADGMRAVAIGAGVLDEIAGARSARPRRSRPAPQGAWSADPRRLLGFARDRIDDLGRAVGVGASVVRASRLDPRGLPALTAAPSGTRRLGTAVLDLEDVRRVRKAAGGTANDVLLAIVAGGLRRWAAERGERLPRTGPRALVPVSRRRPGTPSGPSGPGNTFSAYLLELPVAEPDARARLDAVRAVMDRNRAAGPLRGAGALAVLADQLPPLAHRLGTPLAGGAARMLFDLLVTSVPLPRSALSLGGCPLGAIYPMAPLPRGQSLSIAMAVYGGRVHMGLVADGKALPDLDRLTEHLGEETARLLDLTLR